MSFDAREVMFQELTSAEHLRASLALRFAVYRETKGLCRMPSLDEASGLDVDEFDPRSRHFGLVTPTARGSRVIGSLRVTAAGPPSHASSIVAAVADAPSAVARLIPRCATALPSLHYSEAQDQIQALLDEASARGERVIEAGRFVLARECLVCGVSGTARLAAFLVLGSAALLDLDPTTPNILANCHAHHEGFYRPVGFRPLAGGSPMTEPALGLRHVVLHRRPEWASSEAMRTCTRVARDVERTGGARMGVRSHVTPAGLARPTCHEAVPAS